MCFEKFLDSISPKHFPTLMDTDNTRFIVNKDIHDLRSGYEKLTASALDRLRIKWEYEPYIVLISYKKGRHVIYVPDFYLPQYRVFIEVKGVWDIGAFRKVKMLSQTYPVIVLLREDIRKLGGAS
jgi:hypothetical protein